MASDRLTSGGTVQRAIRRRRSSLQHGRYSSASCYLSLPSSPATCFSRRRLQQYTKRSYPSLQVRTLRLCLRDGAFEPQAKEEGSLTGVIGMTVGLVLLFTSGDSIRNLISFDYQIFFNLLLPPIILSSGYELHQANFFRNIGTILTFAFAGTFLSAIVIGLILWLFTLLPGTLDMTLVDAISVGATLSATDPVTILAIFNTYKVDPKLYTIIFGESILNDAIAIVIFETAQRYNKGEGSYGILSFFEGTGIFLLVFFSSLVIGVISGVGTALLLKFTYVRRFPKIESCLIVLIAYATYFFSHGIHLSGTVPSCLEPPLNAQCLHILQVSCRSCSVESPSSTMRTSTCLAAHNSPRNISSKSFPSSPRISSSSIWVSPSLQITPCSSILRSSSLPSSPSVPPAGLLSSPYLSSLTGSSATVPDVGVSRHRMNYHTTTRPCSFGLVYVELSAWHWLPC